MSSEPLPVMDVGLNRLLGLELRHFGPDGGEAHVTLDERHHQPWGLVHGGLYCAVVETVASISGTKWLESIGGGRCVGVNNNTDFLRAVSDGRIVATSTPIHRGRRQQLWLVEIEDAAGKALARGQVRLQNM
jgi:1,4-dihydroxy-2-naphthoyl-CoA hydrolase